MYIVVVDDERTFAVDTKSDTQVVYLRTADEALAFFANWWTENFFRPSVASPRVIDELWFDHDLGDGPTAMVVANFLYALNEVNKNLAIGAIYVHSQNPVGRQKLLGQLRYCSTIVIPQPLPQLV